MKNIKLNYSQNLLVLPQTTYLVLTVNPIYHMIYNLFTPITGFFFNLSISISAPKGNLVVLFSY